MAQPTSDLLTTGEVAALFRVSRMTIARWVDDGKLHAVHLPSGRKRFRRDLIEGMLHADPEQAGS